MSSINQIISNTKFNIRKNSPEILLGFGIISAAASIILACFATKKIDSIVKPSVKRINDIHSHMVNEDELANNQYSISLGKKELAKEYVKTGGKLILLYSPAFITFALSISCLIGSHNVMQGRNLALTAACATLQNGYDAYRDRVRAKLGDEAEKKIYEDIHEEKKEIVDENGKKKTITVKVPHNNNDFNLLYAENQSAWERDAKLNLNYLLAKQAYFNDKLRLNGYLFLSDVYEELGFTAGELGPDRVRASHILGWIYDPSDKTRDSYVSLGLTDRSGTITQDVQQQIARNEPNFWLNLNYDGDILTGEKGRRIFTEVIRYRDI